MKLWAGRFSKELDENINSFNSSISFDFRLYKEDISGSIVHAMMLAKQGIISEQDKEEIFEGLSGILHDIESGALVPDPTAEDIHMFVEAELTKRIGDAGKRLHTARSRNDQVAQDTKSYLIGEADNIYGMLGELLETIAEVAEKHTDTIMPGYTHLQRAQPITFAHHIMAYARMFMRDRLRIEDCLNRMILESPLGSGALAGTTYPIDRYFTAENTGYSAPSANSLDGVSDRDFCIELSGCISIIMMHLSRFSEEIIMWCSWEFKFIELDDAFATGSSIMPQKKNPDIAELVRGKTGRVYGDLISLLTMMKALPLAYNKDMQEDKEATFDAVDTVKECLGAFTPMLATIKVNKDNMRNAAAKGFINATDCADYLVKKGLPFRDAYKITGELVAYCITAQTTLEDLDFSVYESSSPLFGEDIYNAINLETCVKNRTSYGAAARVSEQIDLLKQHLNKN